MNLTKFPPPYFFFRFLNKITISLKIIKLRKQSEYSQIPPCLKNRKSHRPFNEYWEGSENISLIAENGSLHIGLSENY